MMKAFLVFMVIYGVAVFGYEFFCPDRSQRQIYSKAACPNPTDFTCLKDALVDEYIKSCNVSRPVSEGYKYVFRHGYDREKCVPSRYQPFIFHRNQQSDCFYLKSTCNEEGQIMYSSGSTTTDATCKCDEKNRFTFVTEPRNKIFCIPSEEDCSCYREPISVLYTNGTYNTTKQNLTMPINGTMIDSSQLRNTQIDDTKYNLKGIEQYSWYCAISLTVALLVMISIIIIYWKYRKLLGESSQGPKDAVSTTEIPESSQGPKDAMSTTEIPESSESLSDDKWKELDEQYGNLITYGTYESYDNTIYLSGACNVGKSTLASHFIGHDIPTEWKSTDGLMIYFGQNGIDLINKIMVPLREGLNVFSKIIIGEINVDKDVLHQKHNRQENRPKTKKNLKDRTTQFSSTTTKHTEDQFFKLTNEFINGVRRGQYNIRVAPSDIVDFGGQRSYDMTHQLFIRQKGTFIVMFDGRYGFSVPLPEYPGINMTNEEIVKHWVNSILTFTVEGKDRMPMIVFAATHSDDFFKENLEAKKEEFLNTLQGYFGNHPMRDHIVLDTLYFINGRNPKDEEIERLKAKLVEIAMSQSSWGERKPVRWVPLELQMEAMKKDHRYIVRKEELVRANALNGDLALSRDQLEEFLEYQHSNGKIMYINKAGLGEFVILYPPAAVNILRSFITDKMFWPEGKIASMLETIYSTGTISKQQLIAIWDQEWVPIKSAEERDFVIRLLVYLDVLIIPRRNRDSDVSYPEKEDIFFVPCIIKNKLPMDFLEEEDISKRSLALVFTIKRTCIPPSLSYKLIGAVASIWSLKVEDTKTLLFQFAAVLDIDEENEIRIFVQDNMIITYLTNKQTKQSIASDMAASIQECLVNTLDLTLSFYFGNMKSGRPSFDVKDLYDMQIGEVCNKKPCVIPVGKARASTIWKCSHGNTHHQSYLALKWIFRSHTTCPPDCKGLEHEILNNDIDDRYSIRLAKQIGIERFKQMMFHLGIETETLEDLEYEYGKPIIAFKYVCLQRWRDRTKHPRLKDIQQALSKIDDNRHHLCEITRNVSEFDEFTDIDLEVALDDTVLMELAHNMGNCTLHLAIELGLKFPDVEQTTNSHPKDMFQQTFDILKKWNESTKMKPTLSSLIRAVKKVEKGGLNFLREKFKIQ